MTETKKTRRPRNLGTVIVQSRTANGDAGTWYDVDIPTPLSTDSAPRWIKENGEAGLTYRVARVYPAVRVGVVTSEVRTLAPAD